VRDTVEVQQGHQRSQQILEFRHKIYELAFHNLQLSKRMTEKNPALLPSSAEIAGTTTQFKPGEYENISSVISDDVIVNNLCDSNL
jgi:hypothetical protein